VFQHGAVLGAVHALRSASTARFRAAFGHGPRLRTAPDVGLLCDGRRCGCAGSQH
jgi:hypothetical protein